MTYQIKEDSKITNPSRSLHNIGTSRSNFVSQSDGKGFYYEVPMEQLGWIKLHRKLLTNRIFNNKDLLQLWIWCLLKANHKDNIWEPVVTGKGKTEVMINKGSFVFGRNAASKELGQKPISTYKRLLKLKKLQFLNIQSNTHYSIVTICNWDRYQNEETKEEQAKEQAGNKQVTTKEQPSNTNKNDKNGKKEKNSFIKPTLEEVTQYCTERNNGINPEKFIDFYESKGWMVGKNKMKDWKASVRTWEKKDENNSSKEKQSKQSWGAEFDPSKQDPNGNRGGNAKTGSEIEPGTNDSIQQAEELSKAIIKKRDGI